MKVCIGIGQAETRSTKGFVNAKVENFVSLGNFFMVK